MAHLCIKRPGAFARPYRDACSCAVRRDTVGASQEQRANVVGGMAGKAGGQVGGRGGTGRSATPCEQEGGADGAEQAREKKGAQRHKKEQAGGRCTKLLERRGGAQGGVFHSRRGVERSGGIRSINSVRTCSVIVARHQRPEVLQQSRRGQLRRTGCVEAPRHDRIGGLRGEPRKRQSGATRQRVVRRGGPPSTGRDTAHRACQRRCQGPFSRGHPPPGRTFEAYPHRSPIFVPHGASCPSGCPCGDPTGRVDGRRWRRAPARRSS